MIDNFGPAGNRIGDSLDMRMRAAQKGVRRAMTQHCGSTPGSSPGSRPKDRFQHGCLGAIELNITLNDDNRLVGTARYKSGATLVTASFDFKYPNPLVND